MNEQEKAVLDAAEAYDKAYWEWWNSNSNGEAYRTKKVKEEKHDALLDAVIKWQDAKREQ